MLNCSDGYHCKSCGGHYEPSKESPYKCDNCFLYGIEQQMEQQIEDFDGNYEEAARYHGW